MKTPDCYTEYYAEREAMRLDNDMEYTFMGQDPIASTPRPKRGIQRNRVVRIKSAGGLFYLLQVRPVRWLGWVTVYTGDRVDCAFEARKILPVRVRQGEAIRKIENFASLIQIWNRAAQASYRYAAVKALRDWAQAKQRRI